MTARSTQVESSRPGRARAPRPRDVRRGFAVIIVLAAVALLLVVLVAVQVSSWRHSMDGREALARVRAHWAARAGVETLIARLQDEFDQSQPLGARSLLAAMSGPDLASGGFAGASYRVVREGPTGVELGPTDTHAKLNVSLLSADDLMLLPDMTEDVAAAILDWRGAPSSATSILGDAQLYGPEAYAGLPVPYVPRQAPFRSLAELDLVIGVRSEFVRGVDDDLNGLYSEARPNRGAIGGSSAGLGWSGLLTASSQEGGVSPQGVARIDLTATDSSEVASALGVDSLQAEAIIAHAQQSGATMADFIRTPLATLAQQNQPAGGNALANAARRQPAALTRDQLSLLLDECSIGDPVQTTPGKVNINTVEEATLDYLANLTPTQKDALLLYRDQQAGDIAHVTDLLDVPQISNAVLADLYQFLGVRSQVFQAVVRGKDHSTGVQVEMIAELDRSTNPVTLRRLRVR